MESSARSPRSPAAAYLNYRWYGESGLLVRLRDGLCNTPTAKTLAGWLNTVIDNSLR